MYKDKKIIVVMPAYNAEKTLLMTHKEILEQGIVDLIIVVDDASQDKTVEIARNLEKTVLFKHQVNLGYGGIFFSSCF
ncbi:MAG: glycosyltransferase [Desulfamplus sp.]|nr:glycosyltransferase [Desulfamplus sp.]